MAPLTNGAERGRRSRVVLTPRRWRQALRSDAQGDGDKQARSPGRSRRKPLKPLCAGMPGGPGEPTVTTSCALYPFRTRDCGRIKRPAFPTPFSGKAQEILHTSDASAPREHGAVFVVALPGVQDPPAFVTQTLRSKPMDSPRTCANGVFTSKTACGICARGRT